MSRSRGISRALVFLLLPFVTALWSSDLAAAQLDAAGKRPVVLASEATQTPMDLGRDPLFDDDEEPDHFPDPLERMNRGIFRLNRGMNRWVFDPFTQGYRFVTPVFFRRSLRNAITNLNSGPFIVNNALQLEWSEAGQATARVLLNSTLGLGGLFDPATYYGIAPVSADFGQTLALAGVGSGPYLVVPILGPTCVRDVTGELVDAFMRPTLYVLGPFEILLYAGADGLATLEANSDELKALEESSIDFYASLRNAYYQRRLGDIWKGRKSLRRPK